MAKSDPPEGTERILQLQFIGDQSEYEELYLVTHGVNSELLELHLREGSPLPVEHIVDGEHVETVINMRHVTMATIVPVGESWNG